MLDALRTHLQMLIDTGELSNPSIAFSREGIKATNAIIEQIEELK
jgi:hypothetical protein